MDGTVPDQQKPPREKENAAKSKTAKRSRAEKSSPARRPPKHETGAKRHRGVNYTIHRDKPNKKEGKRKPRQTEIPSTPETPIAPAGGIDVLSNSMYFNSSYEDSFDDCMAYPQTPASMQKFDYPRTPLTPSSARLFLESGLESLDALLASPLHPNNPTFLMISPPNFGPQSPKSSFYPEALLPTSPRSTLTTPLRKRSASYQRLLSPNPLSASPASFLVPDFLHLSATPNHHNAGDAFKPQQKTPLKPVVPRTPLRQLHEQTLSFSSPVSPSSIVHSFFVDSPDLASRAALPPPIPSIAIPQIPMAPSNPVFENVNALLLGSPLSAHAPAFRPPLMSPPASRSEPEALPMRRSRLAAFAQANLSSHTPQALRSFLRQ